MSAGIVIAPSAKCMASPCPSSSALLPLEAKGIHAPRQRQILKLATNADGARGILGLGSKSQLLQTGRLSSGGSVNRRNWSGCVTRGPVQQQLSPEPPEERKEPDWKKEKLGPLDQFLLKAFRVQMAEEVGWDSSKAGFEGLLEVVKHLYLQSSKPEVEKAVVRVFTALFPEFVMKAYRNIILPVGSGKPGAILMAYVTQATTYWLMGPSVVNQVTLADGSTLPSGVLVERCKFLEGSQCAGVCTHMCKIPTQAFIKDVLGTSLHMEPNFNDFSCQFNFGAEALPRDQDPGLQTPCLSICPTAAARATLRRHAETDQCPQEILLQEILFQPLLLPSSRDLANAPILIAGQLQFTGQNALRDLIICSKSNNGASLLHTTVDNASSHDVRPRTIEAIDGHRSSSDDVNAVFTFCMILFLEVTGFLQKIRNYC